MCRNAFAGFEIARFCYHERLSIAGNCRMCLVEVVGGANTVLMGPNGRVGHNTDVTGIVEALRLKGVRVHTRKADHYSGNILDPMGLDSCIRVSMCHYNSEAEVAKFLAAMQEIAYA